ncbi:vesicle transport through interaction with t-SNAREs homolog 1A-like isoform X3 [Neocloeon triangulifer]|uniref:vesicle transport through interaction with t-SNAREs homolog 1A-like isoform X3 n=1 Tax=Neocloeon triangulifer TaxID=2078957 RepID=UPI00286ED93A|nr:vesicle transport through interaction with t-SNAREs homolog 1A-like isoform X3 [Neocloeon triangulifer]
MAALLETYEQQYAVLTADITSKIGRIPNLSGYRKDAVFNTERQIEEAKELLEQMELEIREVDSTSRPKYANRLDSYKAELKRLMTELKSKSTYHDGMSEDNASLYGDASSTGFQEEQRQRLLDNSEKIERTGRQLQAGYRIALETEEIGTAVMRDLHSQRETLQRARNRLRETDAELGRSSRIINSMIARSIQHRVILFVVGVAIVGAIIFAIYVAASN